MIQKEVANVPDLGGRRSTIISSLHLVESGADSSACPTIPFPMSRRLNRFMASWHSAGGGDLAGSAELSR